MTWSAPSRDLQSRKGEGRKRRADPKGGRGGREPLPHVTCERSLAPESPFAFSAFASSSFSFPLGIPLSPFPLPPQVCHAASLMASSGAGGGGGMCTTPKDIVKGKLQPVSCDATDAEQHPPMWESSRPQKDKYLRLSTVELSLCHHSVDPPLCAISTWNAGVRQVLSTPVDDHWCLLCDVSISHHVAPSTGLWR